ncbi:serine/threonine-protein kinase [Sorangium atrum]|uniref:Protein kinase n=1 Tax=Sorangium atrum TaxID=2995308 RepID=A0ABT5CD72_9BACT|nr:serine/threonine-protein kinase [Sorangium aterium]MDC0683076.1 protein kinase [Sorangium aterium]
MLHGRLLADRFEVVDLAGTGGMGTVYRTVDRASGDVVAVKLLGDVDAQAAARFGHEARALATLDHPHVVRYVTHGVAPTGEPYLAMEWLSGESLSARLSRGPLDVEESVALVRAVADALGAAHARGIVHRDIKPSNLFLPGGAADRVKVLDFGIARLSGASARLTRTGALVGTIGYMAPEQASGERAQLDARADVFSLGCVLFECLTGRPAFQGRHLMTILTKLLQEEPPRASALRPEVPQALDELVAQMLAKRPAERPADGAAVVRCLDALGASTAGGARSSLAAVELVTAAEVWLCSIVAVGPTDVSAPASTAIVPADRSQRSAVAAVRHETSPLGAAVQELASGAVVAILAAGAGAGSATDQAAIAARCALRIRASVPGANVVLVTGRGEATGRSLLGEVLDRAAALLDDAAARGRPGHLRVAVDAVTRALLDARFEVAEQDGLSWVEAEREVADGARRLLGKPSPYVGRARELRSLLDLVEESFTERRAAVALVTAAAGVGKSRLRHELVQALRPRHPELVLGVGSGDSIGAGSAFAMLAGSLRGALGIAAGEAPEAQREKLARAVGQLFAGEQQRRVACFLGELLGVPLADDGPMLRAARQDPAHMADRIQEAYLDYARAVTSARPMLVVLEDLHWGDAPSVKIFDHTLRALCERPYAVLAFARPEVHELFPRLWIERGLTAMRLRELSARAAEQLVRGALGASVEPGTVAAIVERAAGNAFYLEELVRAVAEGRGGALPETVLGMVEARLAALEPEVRRLLRAASVFGDVSWIGGVSALVGARTLASGASDADALAELFDREILERRPSSRLAGQEEIAFRHALLREGAYAMLTERDRAVGHRLAGEWLLSAGEQDPMVLAEHFARGGDGPRAGGFYLRAATLALHGADVQAALAAVEKGIACGAEGEPLAELHLLRMNAFIWTDDAAHAHASALQALELAAPGSLLSWRALSGAMYCVALCDDRRAVEVLVPRLLAEELPVDVLSPELATRIVFSLLWDGRTALAERIVRRLELVIAPVVEGDLHAALWIEFTRGFWRCHAARDLWGALQANLAAARRAESLGSGLFVPWAWMLVAIDYTRLGDMAAADECLDRVLATEGLLDYVFTTSVTCRIVSLLERRRITEALEMAGSLLQHMLARGDRSRSVIPRQLLAEGRMLLGELALAEEELCAAGDPAAMAPFSGAVHLSLFAEIRLRQGRTEEACAMAGEALALQRQAGTVFLLRQEVIPALYAEALHAKGDAEGARAVVREERAALLARAARIEDPAFRRSFLENVSANARTLALARALLGE